MSAVTSNPSYSGALSILSSSTDAPTKATDDTESAGEKLIDVAKAATSGKSSSTATTPTDTISLSDQAKTYLSASKSSSSSSSGDALSSSTSASDDIYDRLASQLQDDFAGVSSQNPGFAAAFKNKTLTITNTNDVAGLDFQDHHTVTGGGTGTTDTYSFNTAVFNNSNPNQLLMGDGQGNEYLLSWT